MMGGKPQVPAAERGNANGSAQPAAPRGRRGRCGRGPGPGTGAGARLPLRRGPGGSWLQGSEATARWSSSAPFKHTLLLLCW